MSDDEIIIAESDVEVVSAAELNEQGTDNAVLLAQPRMLIRWYVDHFPTMAIDPEGIQRRIVENIMAMSAVDVLNVRESLDSSRTIIGKPIRLESVEAVLPSEYGGIYIVTNVILLQEGEKKQISMGSPTILAQVKVLIEADSLPIECKVMPIRRGGKNGRNAPLYLRPINY